MPTFRTALPSDLPHLARIDELWSSRDRRLAIEAAILELQLHVAVIDDAAVACGLVHHRWFGHPFIELLIVAPDHRRKGIGSALVHHMIEATGRDKVFTSANQSNTAMRNLLAGAGFVRSGIIENLDVADPELVFVWIASHEA